MVLGLLRIRLRFVARSRKEKRALVQSVVQRLRHRYNAAISEAGDFDAPDLVTIAVACIARDSAHADSQLQNIARAVGEWRLDAEIVDIETERISV